MFKVNVDDILLVETCEGVDVLAKVVNYFISPVDNTITLLLKCCDSNMKGLFTEDQVIGKVQLRVSK